MIDSMNYVIYQHMDLEPIRRFLLDFGMLVADESDDRIYFRGYGEEPFIYVAEKGAENKFVGVGLKVASREALEGYAARFGVSIEQSDRPGGGQRIVIQDPDGKPMELVHGAVPVEPITVREPVSFNEGGKRNRLGRIPIFENAPVPVLALCHTVMSSPKPQKLMDWLCQEFGAYPSDVIVFDNQVPMLAFLRFPKGQEFVQHHHIAVSLGSKPGAQHTCFETIDLDAVFMGHRFLRQRGHKPAWGPVRHSLGGAISDYWRDPSGFILEHVTDGDYVNDDCKTVYSPASSESSTLQWTTNPLPSDFIE
jgi:catechol 2,3-dioxygenase-like lactoylglutathione lyase family enzyme